MKVLIAEDELAARRILEATLINWGYEVTVAHNGTEASQALDQPDAPRLAILDWMMPGCNGVDLCRRIRSRREAPYTYILLLTGKSRKQDIIDGLDAGADDYITKPFDAQELKVRLRTGRRILDLQEELIEARDALHEQATHDSLTGIWNRSAILDVLARELARAQRDSTSLAVSVADLDNFKNINDTFGHKVGDIVLRESTQRLGSQIRSYDAIGRIGGEEFLIILPGCDETSAVNQAERLRAGLAREPFETPTGLIRITVSMGVAVYSPELRAWKRAPRHSRS